MWLQTLDAFSAGPVSTFSLLAPSWLPLRPSSDQLLGGRGANSARMVWEEEDTQAPLQQFAASTSGAFSHTMCGYCMACEDGRRAGEQPCKMCGGTTTLSLSVPVLFVCEGEEHSQLPSNQLCWRVCSQFIYSRSLV